MASIKTLLINTKSIGSIFNFLTFCILIIVLFHFNQYQCTVVELTDKNFAQVVSSRPFTMVMFYADWCHHCHELIPELEAADELLVQNRIHAIAKVNCDAGGKGTCEKMAILGFPTVYVMIYGKVADHYKGDYKSTSITNYIISKLSQVLGSNPSPPATTPTYNYPSNYWQSRPPSIPQPYDWQQNMGFSNIVDGKSNKDRWMHYNVYNPNQNFNNIRGSYIYGPLPRYQQYGEFWPSSNMGHPNFPKPIKPSGSQTDMLYRQTMDFSHIPSTYNPFYNIYPPSTISWFDYFPFQNTPQYVNSISWPSMPPTMALTRNFNQWYNTNPNYQTMNNFFDYPQRKTNWFEYTGMKKHNINPEAPSDTKSNPNNDWVWNPDLDLGHRPAVRQYMVPTKYRSNAIKSIYLRGVLSKYLNEKESDDQGLARKQSIPTMRSTKELPPLHNHPTNRLHPSKTTDAFKLIVDALKSVDHK